MPPWIRIDSRVASRATSDAKYLAMPASMSERSPASARAACPPGEQARRLHLGGDVGKLELNGLELYDRLAEGLALPRIFESLVECFLGDSNGASSDIDATHLEAGNDLLETESLLSAEEVLDGHSGVIELDLAAFGTLVSDLSHVARDDESRRFLLNQEDAHAPMGRVSFGVGLDQNR